MKVLVGNSDSLLFDNNRVDKIFCVNVVYFWENPVLHLQEIHRVLNPGGYFGVGFRPRENLSKFPFSRFGFILYSEKEWKDLIEQNGFIFIKSDTGKELGIKSGKANTLFESLCVICGK